MVNFPPRDFDLWYAEFECINSEYEEPFGPEEAEDAGWDMERWKHLFHQGFTPAQAFDYALDILEGQIAQYLEDEAKSSQGTPLALP